MSLTVCLVADTLYHPQSGGHHWVYLNWALGLLALGCRVIWLERVTVNDRVPVEKTETGLVALKSRLERFGLAEGLALWCRSGEMPPGAAEGCLDLDAAADADLLLNQKYSLPPEVVGHFRRSALLDIDPGLLQLWISEGQIRPARHDAYFTIGETVGRPGARFPDAGLPWQYTPPCVALDWWPPCPAAKDAPFTTVSHWWMGDHVSAGGEVYSNDKRARGAGGPRVARPGIRGRGVNPSGLPAVRPDLSRGVQLCQALLRPAGERLGQ
jgi:hypothetical protein